MIALLVVGYRSLPQRISTTLNVDTALAWSGRAKLRMAAAAGDRQTTVPRTWLLTMTVLMGWQVLSAWFRDGRGVTRAGVIINVGLVLANAFLAVFTYYSVAAARRPTTAAIGYLISTSVARRLTLAFWCVLALAVLYCLWALRFVR